MPCSPIEKELPAALQESVARIRENCEPALCTVLFMGGAGGSLRAGVTENPVKLTHSVGDALTRVTCGGAPVYIWPGGGITFMVDVSRLPENAFGYVPTPALVAPIEFSLKLSDYAALGGYMDHVRPIASIHREEDGRRHVDGKAGESLADGTGQKQRNERSRANSNASRRPASPHARWTDRPDRGSIWRSDRCSHAYRAAVERFVNVLDELCGELTFLRQATRVDGPVPDGVVARRMVKAVRSFAARVLHYADGCCRGRGGGGNSRRDDLGSHAATGLRE